MPVTQDQIQRAVDVAKRYGATRVILFGSAATHPETARDLDLAVAGVLGWEFFGMAAEMEQAARIALDVVPLEPETRFIRYIRERGRVLYEGS
ncbi:MAG TPA: nucleotidyltransferase domain-containing protein [Rhodothermales bacterium]|nr:nucleotidyltransferase domain-containing protein [Rhodothermales bacterium]